MGDVDLAGRARPYIFAKEDLTDADLREADLHGSVFEDCVLERAAFTGADLSDARFVRGGGSRMSFSGADLADAVFDTVDLSAARFGGALLTGASFTGCRMIGAVLEACRGFGYHVTRSNLTLANLKGCGFARAELYGIRFDEATLERCDFTDATFTDCRLIGAQLAGATFAGADLRGADLGDLDLDDLRALRGAGIGVDQAARILAAMHITVLPPAGEPGHAPAGSPDR